MELTKRERYINKIKPFVNKPVIKILTGMRRVGKSTILEQIKDDILKEISNQNKIYMNFEFMDFDDYKNLKNYLSKSLESIEENQKVYFFFDEIQLVDGWEKVINALRLNHNYDIYITGSNSNIISGELATLLAGRYVEFEIEPFTFSEFIEQYENSSLSTEELFKSFINIGGMPGLKYFDMEKESSYKYLQDIYNTVIVKDVMQHNSIRNIDVFNRIMGFAVENIGHTFSANKIHKYFKSENRDISVDTILNYLDYLQKAFVLQRVSRYDTKGKKLLKTDEKYYITDHGFRAAMGFSNEKDIERVLENIVYIELLSRGYSVEIGKVDKKEVDFIAKRNGEIKYFQISYLMENDATREREFGVYREIKDNYPKYVLSMDKVDFSQDGIIHRNVIEFLLDY